jgi:tRNA modification GTPase
MKSIADMIASVLTPAGRGAIATILFIGDSRRIDAQRLFLAANGRPLSEQQINRSCFGRWGNEVTEDVVVCRVDSKTVEIHCHGGNAAVARILKDLETIGCRTEKWQTAFESKMNHIEIECREMLARSTTLRTARILLEQTNLLASAYESLRVDASTRQLETRTAENSATRERLLNKISELLRWSEFGLHLTRPWNVVFVGRPNVGKSSLINALLGYARTIVFDQPGTTRDVVTAETAFDGWPVLLADTAGIRDGASELELAGIEQARQRLSVAECRLVLLDTSRDPHPDDHQLLRDWPDALVVANKCDLTDRWGDAVPESSVRTSAVENVGIEALANRIVAQLIPELPASDCPIPISSRQIELLQTANEHLLADDWMAYSSVIDLLQ